MKPYFAKLLPVPRSLPPTKARGQEHRLYLCSRNINSIEYGEKVYFDDTNTWDVISSINFDENHVIKVIGKISLGATWVKEGDEFDRNDLLVHEWGGSSVRKPIEFAKITEESKILIKDPYGHFH